MTEQLRLMAVHAHPDDESSKGAATMAKYVSEGVDVLVVTCTGGERGDVLNPKLKGDPYIEENIHEVQVITTYDENGGYPHPDHIMTHKISMVAFEGAGDPDRFPEDEFGKVFQPMKLYYNQGFNRPRTTALHEALLARGMESPYGEWLERWHEME
ncbi:GlcNAc-PI de-N-acetylase, partial [Streptomyces sp. NRRL F-6602]